MGNEETKFQLEEFKELRKEITFLEDSINKYFLAAYISSISLMSLIGAAFFRIGFNDMKCLPPLAAYFFLFPSMIVISILLIISSHRKGIHRIGTYIQVFLEEKAFGDGWESRLDNFRKNIEGECHDYIPWSFWIIIILSNMLYGCVLFWFIIKWNDINAMTFCHIIIPSIIIIAMCFAHKSYNSASIETRVNFYKIWKDEYNKGS